MRASKWLFIFAYMLLLLLATSRRASGQVSDPIQYKLYAGSSLEYGCFGPCACPVAISGPLRGTFTFYRTSVDPLFDHYALVNIDWAYTIGDSAPGTLRTVYIKGHGTYDVGGEVALTQRMVLELRSDGGLAQHFDSGSLRPRPRNLPRYQHRRSRADRDLPGLHPSCDRRPPGCGRSRPSDRRKAHRTRAT